MSAMIPMAVYGLEVPAGDVAIPAISEIPSAFRITMAAIDPSAEAEGEPGAVPRATLKIIRQSLEYDESEDEEDFDVDEMERMLGVADDDEDDDEDSEEELVNGGPSDPAKSKKSRKAAAEAEIQRMLEEEDMDVDEMPNGTNGIQKSAKALGKMAASDDDEDDDEDEDDSDDDEGGEWEEFVICTLDPNSHYNQPLDITVGERERVLFKVSGTHSIFLTGNYVEPAGHDHGPGMYDPDSDEEEDYDMEPDSDELDEDDELDELDELDDPRITEMDDEDGIEAPVLVQASKQEKKQEKKGKNKRSAEDAPTAGIESIDDLIAKEVVKDEEKLSKKQLKKLKKNDGSAATTAVDEAIKDTDATSSAKSDKKVSFAKELEQGPTPTKDGKAGVKEKPKTALGVKIVQGVTVDDKKLGTGAAAKTGDRVSMRYIGKLKTDGKVFDSNKKGKPFSFKLGAGEVIKGWDIGIQGLSAGGERRITIPAHLAYGSKGVAGIPGNADLVFDVKLLDITKK